MSDSTTPSENTGRTVHDAPVENVGQWTRNLTYWHADGSIVIRVEGILYNIHVSTLGKVAPDIASILAIPSGKPEGDPMQEGTERFPLHLTGLSVQEFEDFLYWLYRVEWTPMTNRAEKERILTNLLKVTDMWNIEVGKRYAITHLQTMHLPASRRLELARKYSIHGWVEEAVTDIFQHKLSVLSDVDLASLDLKVYSILVRGMERMEVEIRRTANVAPKMPDASQADWRCSKHQVCIATWKQLWWDQIGRKLLHPDTPIRTGDIVNEVKQLSHKDLNETCRLDVVKEIETNLEFVDKRIISAVVTAIVAYHSALV